MNTEDIDTKHSAVIPWKTLWIATGIILFLMLALIGCVLYFYTEHVKDQCYLMNRKDFIEQHKEVQWVLAAESFCYEPRGGLLRPAKYVGRNRYEVKP